MDYMQSDEDCQDAGHALPLLVWDGECEFCCMCIGFWKLLGVSTVDQSPYQKITVGHHSISRANFGQAVHLVFRDGRASSGAQAVIQALSHVAGLGWLRWMYDWVPSFATISEGMYGFLACRRSLLSRLVRHSNFLRLFLKPSVNAACHNSQSHE